jgi:dihydroorotate dehydrogenase
VSRRSGQRAPRLAALESRLRPALVKLPASLAVRLYSRGRRSFLDTYTADPPWFHVEPPASLACTLWGLPFRSPLGNAAGVFKTGDGYTVVARQGAGFYLAGTTTATPRRGNRRAGIVAPFAPYPRSGAASNWLGLPNPGHQEVARKLAAVARVDGCPLAASVAADPLPELSTQRKLADLVAGLETYAAAGVDVLEMNESCPNTEADDDFAALLERLGYVAEHFLAHRRRPVPVIVKFSTDTEPAQVPQLLDALLDLGFDGVNFGNTSIAYGRLRASISPAELPLFDHFVKTFGGGVSGRPLREGSLALVETAVRHLERNRLAREFHVVRTGGVESAGDVAASLAAGASLVQWYSGYFEAFARHGHRVYAHLYDGLPVEP